jgi:hypothetical protein
VELQLQNCLSNQQATNQFTAAPACRLAETVNTELSKTPRENGEFFCSSLEFLSDKWYFF